MFFDCDFLIFFSRIFFCDHFWFPSDDWELPDDDNSFLNVKLPDEDFRDDQDLEGINLPPEDLDFSNEDFDVDDDVNESANSSKEEVSSGTVSEVIFLLFKVF